LLFTETINQEPHALLSVNCSKTEHDKFIFFVKLQYFSEAKPLSAPYSEPRKHHAKQAFDSDFRFKNEAAYLEVLDISLPPQF
jgi:hypothetical protein